MNSTSRSIRSIRSVLLVVSLPLLASAAPAQERAGFPSAPARVTGWSAGASDRVALSFPAEGVIRLLDANGSLIREFGSLPQPLGLAVAANRVYVGLGAHGAVRAFDFDARPRGWLGRGLGEFERPSDLAVSPLDGRIYVLDAGRGEVRIFDPLSLQEVGRVGDGVLAQPAGLLVAPDGSVLVGELIRGTVERFDAAGFHSGSFTNFGSQPGQTVRPTGLARDAQGRIYVADAFLDQVAVFRADGVFVRALGGFGTGPGLMRNPLAVWVSPGDGRVWVTDSGDLSVETFPAVQ